MIREKIINYLTKRNIKSRSMDEMKTYADAHSIGIFFNSGKVTYEEIKELAHTLSNEGKEVSILAYAERMDGPVLYDVVAKREISMMGTIKSPEFEKFSRGTYDFIILVDPDMDPTMQYLGSLCKAQCKIGLYHESEPGVVDFQLKSSPGDVCKDLVKYIKMIK